MPSTSRLTAVRPGAMAATGPGTGRIDRGSRERHETLSGSVAPCFQLLFFWWPHENGLPKKGFPVFSRVTEQLRPRIQQNPWVILKKGGCRLFHLVVGVRPLLEGTPPYWEGCINPGSTVQKERLVRWVQTYCSHQTSC